MQNSKQLANQESLLLKQLLDHGNQNSIELNSKLKATQPGIMLIKKRQLKNSTALHEANFAKLSRVFPGLSDLKGKITGRGPNNSHVEIQVLESSKYTKTFSLKLKQDTVQKLIPAMQLKIRNYYDASVTEVLAFQTHHRLNPRYNYPNPEMYQSNEKWQTNQFLGEWLDHCLRARCVFLGDIELLDA